MRKTNERATSGTSQTAASRINAVQGGDIAGGDRSKSTVRIPLAQIEIGAGTQARTRIDNALAEEYAEAMRDGAFFPPVIVFSDGKNTYLADGFHRVEAARRCGFLDIDAIVEQGTARDALWYALGANKAHGMRMSRADVRRAIGLALQEFLELSNREIARQIGCGDQLVGEVRAELESNCVIRAVEKTVGADGKCRPAKRKARPALEGIPAESPTDVSSASTDTPAEDIPLEPTPSANAVPEQPVEQDAKPVGMEIATQALELLRTIPADDTQRMQAITLISRWLIEVTTASGYDGIDRPGEVVDLAPGGAVQ